MNKLIISMLCTVFIGSACIAAGTNSFAECLKNCSEFYSSQTVSLPSVNLTTTRQILGLDGGLCKYKETVFSQDSVYMVNCKFDKTQRASLAKVMEEFDSNPANENFDMNDFDRIQNTKVYEAWAKYLQDPEVCQIITK
ncbi:hypothetical protein J6S88_01515 [bacterium]|nr:hypothetical protein [bacterium]